MPVPLNIIEMAYINGLQCPTTLFKCWDLKTPMEFVLCLKNTPLLQIKQLVKCLVDCGAKVHFGVREHDNKFSILLVDHEEVVQFLGPAFKLEYVEKCLEDKKIQDISDFRQSTMSHIAKEVDPMDVVYFRHTGWDAFVSETDKIWIRENADQSDSSVENYIHLSESENESENSTPSNISESSFVPLSSSNTDCEDFVDDCSDADSSIVFTFNFDCLKRPDFLEEILTFPEDVDGNSQEGDFITESTDNQQQRLDFLDEIFTFPEDVDGNSQAGDCVKEPTDNQQQRFDFLEEVASMSGDSVENDQGCVSEPTSQFDPQELSEAVQLNRNKQNKKASKPTSSTQVSSKTPWLSAGSSNHSSRGSKKPRMNEKEADDDIFKPSESNQSSSAKNWIFVDDFESDSSAEDIHVEPEQPRNQILLDEFDSWNPGQDKKKLPRKSKKHSRQPYTEEERAQILKYIVDHDEYLRVKGRELWVIMERKKVCTNRTWQSMKEHFLKKIVSNLDVYSFLTKSQIMKIKKSC